METGKIHFKGLNSLRFLAALFVVLCHVPMNQGSAGLPNPSWGAFFFRGAPAVSFFFTLSGFFLFMTLPLITVMYTAILPRTQAIAAIAFSGGIANLFGGFFGPMMVGWLKSMTGDFSLAFSVLAVFGLIGGLLILAVRLPVRTSEIPVGGVHAVAGE